MDGPGFPLGMLVLVLVVMPVGVALFFGLFALRPLAPAVFCCLRCGASFRQHGWKPYPDLCPACGAAEWNRTGPARA